MNNLNNITKKGDYSWPENQTRFRHLGSVKLVMILGPFWMKPIFLILSVNDRPNRATHDRRNGAIYKWPKSDYRTSLKLVFFTPFQSDIFS